MIKIDDIKKIYENYIPTSIQKLKEVAVMIALIEINKQLHVIFEKRSSIVGQPGDISFIGGHIDDGETPLEAVIREANEECNLKKENIEIIGKNDYLLNFNNIKVYPYVSYIKNIDFKDITHNEEVDFLIPIKLEDLLNAHYQEHISKIEINRSEDFPYELIENGKNYKFFTAKEQTLFYRFNDITIWGMTAKILNSFINNLKNNL